MIILSAGGQNYEARLTLDGVQTTHSFPLNNNDFHDWCWVVNLQDSANNNNSSFQLYLDGNLIFNRNLTYVYDLSTITSPFSLREVKASGATSFLPANAYILYDRPLSSNQVAGYYQNGIRKRDRKSTINDVAINHRNSYFPSSNGYGFRRSNLPYLGGGSSLAAEEFTTTDTSGFFVESNSFPQQFQDSFGRKFFRFNGANNHLIYRGTQDIHKEHYLLLRRRNINGVKQTFLNVRYGLIFEASFTDINTITIDYFFSQSGSTNIKRAVYNSPLINTTGVMCIYLRFTYGSQTTPTIAELRVNGILITETATPQFITNPGNFTTNASRVGIGSSIAYQNYAAIDFYGYLPFYPFYPINTSTASNSFVRLTNPSDYDLLPSYVFLTMGFKEAMQQYDPNFVILNQRDGFYYV